MTEDAQNLYNQLLIDIANEFPRFRIINKTESKFQWLIHNALCIITLGKMNDYLSGYFTTLGQRIYVPPNWHKRSVEDRFVVMCHERVHMRQFRKFTWPGMAFLYLLVPLPMGFAWFRARFEKEAYAETLRAAARVHGLDYIQQSWFRDPIIRQFTGPSYAWMWPFKTTIESWYDEQIRRLRRELTARHPSCQDPSLGQ